LVDVDKEYRETMQEILLEVKIKISEKLKKMKAMSKKSRIKF